MFLILFKKLSEDLLIEFEIEMPHLKSWEPVYNSRHLDFMSYQARELWFRVPHCRLLIRLQCLLFNILIRPARMRAVGYCFILSMKSGVCKRRTFQTVFDFEDLILPL